MYLMYVEINAYNEITAVQNLLINMPIIGKVPHHAHIVEVKV